MQVGLPGGTQDPDKLAQGHRWSLNDTHCRLPGGMMSTMPLVELTGSVELMEGSLQQRRQGRSIGWVLQEMQNTQSSARKTQQTAGQRFNHRASQQCCPMQDCARGGCRWGWAWWWWSRRSRAWWWGGRRWGRRRRRRRHGSNKIEIGRPELQHVATLGDASVLVHADHGDVVLQQKT